HLPTGSAPRPRKQSRAPARRHPLRRPEVEALEDRRVPTTVTNPLSQFPVVVDGQFSGGGEWSDVTPLAFHSPLFPTDTFRETTATAADANSLLYASLAPEDPKGSVGDGIYLMYDYL